MAQQRKTARRRKADQQSRTLAIGAGAALGAIVVGIASAAYFGLFERLARRTEGHPAPDLTGDERPRPTDRAPVDFRPDPTAAVTAAGREALRPATGPGPTLTEPAGSMNSQTAPANG